MYEKIKRLAKKYIPANLIKSNENFLRSIVALKYRGNKYQCNICGYKLSRFIALTNGDLLCPKCGSLPRTRRLLHLLTTEIGLKGKKVLHFSPHKAMATRLKESGIQKYVTSDFMAEFEADKKLDITNIEEPDNSYDLVICYHVLEHIEADRKAMGELYRILKTGGTCVIQTPFKSGAIYENWEITTPEDRLIHFGQDDHVRVYSVDSLVERLEAAAFEIVVKKFPGDSDSSFGLKKGETVLIGRKL